MVMLARTEARSGGSPGRSVRLRLSLPMPAGYRLLWWGAYVDRKLGLNNLPVGRHRVERHPPWPTNHRCPPPPALRAGWPPLCRASCAARGPGGLDSIAPARPLSSRPHCAPRAAGPARADAGENLRRILKTFG